jgi:hypothetical protein
MKKRIIFFTLNMFVVSLFGGNAEVDQKVLVADFWNMFFERENQESRIISDQEISREALLLGFSDLIQEMSNEEFICLIESGLKILTNNVSCDERFEDEPVNIPIYDWVRRFVCSSGCSKMVFVVALIYLERLKRIFVGTISFICNENIRRLFLVALIVADKFLEDKPLSIPRGWAILVRKIYSLNSIKRAEKEFCNRLGWNFSI